MKMLEFLADHWIELFDLEQHDRREHHFLLKNHLFYFITCNVTAKMIYISFLTFNI